MANTEKYLLGYKSQWFLDPRTSFLFYDDVSSNDYKGNNTQTEVNGSDKTPSKSLVILTVPHATARDNIATPSKQHWSDTAALDTAHKIQDQLKMMANPSVDVVILKGTINRTLSDLNRYSRAALPHYAEWKEWHSQLDTLIANATRKKQHIILLDIHSYPGTDGDYANSLGYTILGPYNSFGKFLNDALWGATQPPAVGGENAVMLRASDQLVEDMALIEVNEARVTALQTADYISTTVAKVVGKWLTTHPSDGEVKRSKRLEWIESLMSSVTFSVKQIDSTDPSSNMPAPKNYSEELDYRKKQCEINRSPEVILYNQFSVGKSTLVVVRDDLLCGGAKSRYLPYVLSDPAFRQYREFIYASGWPGGAQASLAATIRHMNSTRPLDDKLTATIFTNPDENSPSSIPQKPFPIISRDILGAQYKLVPQGRDMASAIESYILKDTTGRRKSLETGIPSPVERAVIGRMAECVRDHFRARFTPTTRNFMFDEVWVCAGSAVFIHGLAQVSDLAKEFIGVSVYPDATYPRIPNVSINYAKKGVFTPIDPVTEIPPIPSSINYDAKVWTDLKKTFSESTPKNVLWWNLF